MPNQRNKRRCPTLIFASKSMPKHQKTKLADRALSCLIAELDTMIELLNCDCMEYMATVPDKYFDLAIVDPPYGIGIVQQMEKTVASKSSMMKGSNGITGSHWDDRNP